MVVEWDLMMFNHRKSHKNDDFMGFDGIYPLVMTYIAIGNDYLQYFPIQNIQDCDSP